MQPTPTSGAADRDLDIVQLLRRGSAAAAFEQLVARYQHKVFRLCCAIVRDPGMAEDVAQDSFVRIWNALSRFDERAALSSWIYAIARNRALSALERRRDAASMSDPAVWNEAEAATAVAASAPADHLALLRELVEALPERYRRVLTLFYYEDRSVTEVAALLGAPEGTVKTALFRARALLQQQIQRLGLDDPALWLERGP